MNPDMFKGMGNNIIKSKALSLRIFPEDLKVKLKILAVRQGKSLNQLIIDLLTEALNEQKEG